VAHTMRQPKFVRLIVISLLVGFPPTYTAAASTNASTTESLDPHLPSQHASIATNTSQPPATTAGVIQTHRAQDCDGEAPSTGSVTALRSRLVRLSTLTQGKQCPMPPVPETSPYKEELPP
jgi:hypothetical protein